MSTTVFYSLQNAKINFDTLGRMGLKSNPIYLIAIEQLTNALEALEEGRDINFIIQEYFGGEIKK